MFHAQEFKITARDQGHYKGFRGHLLHTVTFLFSVFPSTIRQTVVCAFCKEQRHGGLVRRLTHERGVPTSDLRHALSAMTLSKPGDGRVVRRCWVNISAPGRPTYLDDSRARAYYVCNRCGWGVFGQFIRSSIISLLFL